MYRLHIGPKFGKRKVGSIKPSEVQEFLAELGERYEASTPITALLVLQGILDLAVADEKIKKNPAKADIVKAPAHAYKKVAPWADSVVLAIIAAHPAHLRAMPVLGAGCGMRAGEWFGLALEDVDFEEMTIHVRRQVKKLRSDFVFSLPKRDKERTIAMSRWVAEHLRAHIEAHTPRPYTLPWEKPAGKPRTHNLLFRGRPTIYTFDIATTTRPSGNPRSSRPESFQSRSRTHKAGDATSPRGSKAHTNSVTTSPA
jgi:integrase